MSKVLQLRRGTTAQNDSFTGAEGEVTVDTEKKLLRLHDGSTAGGKEIGAVQDISGKVNVSGSRGNLAGYGTAANDTACELGEILDSDGSTKVSSLVVNGNTPDAVLMTTVTIIEVSAGTTGTSWVKTIKFSSSSTPAIIFNTGWSWVNGEAPTLAAGGLLVLCWLGSSGVAQFISATSS